MGGYALLRHPAEITVADMVSVLEGPVALTECIIGPQLCQHENTCPVRDPWHVINHVVEVALSKITLADLIDPSFSSNATPLSILGREFGQPSAAELPDIEPTTSRPPDSDTKVTHG